MPESSRDLTDSFCSIQDMVKCLPVSRRNSTSGKDRNQSALFTTVAALGESEKSRKRSSWRCWRATFSSTSDWLNSGRSDRLPLGSPIMPVPPPTSTIGVPPARCRWTSSMTGTRFPTWRLDAVGSKPTYPEIGDFASRSFRPGVTACISPRHANSSSRDSIAAKVTKGTGRWQAESVLCSLGV